MFVSGSNHPYGCIQQCQSEGHWNNTSKSPLFPKTYLVSNFKGGWKKEFCTRRKGLFLYRIHCVMM